MISPWLAADGAVTFTHSAFTENHGNGNSLALAPKQTWSGGFSARHEFGPGVARAGLRLYGIGDRPPRHRPGNDEYKVWWVTSLLSGPVAPGTEGQPERTVPNSDFACAVLAPGWDPSSGKAPTTFIPAMSATKLSAARGDTVHIHVSDGTFVGNCLAGKPLSQDDADLITQRIFPGEFRGDVFDAKTCTATLTTTDAGADDRRKQVPTRT
jgi:hypothetical protein